MQPTPSPARSQHTRRGKLQIFPVTLSIAVIMATLFTCMPSTGLFSTGFYDRLEMILTARPDADPQTLSTPHPQLRIGIVVGHWGHDSGAVCPNGTREVDVNLAIALLVQQQLEAQGYQVDLLAEFDPRLQNYQAVALVSIHNDSCVFINEQATGFKVAAAMASFDPNRAARLAECLSNRYHQATGLPFHAGSITHDMTEYHAFDEVNPNTVAAIIETGFLNLDYQILTTQPDLVATGVANGILCFIRNESFESIMPTQP